MRSIPLAMTWEMLHRGRWTLFAAALGATAFPLIVFAALWRTGGVDPNDPSMLVMHVVMMQLNAFVFGAAVLGAQGALSRLYALPAPASSIVAWRMLPAMALLAIESVVSTAVLNALFHLNWPLWGPALFLAVLLAAVQAVIWLTERSLWLPVAVAGVALVLGLWFKSRYGAPFSTPERYWRTMAPADAATLAAIAALAYVTGLAAVSRNRRGDPPLALGLVAWLQRAWDGPASVSPLSFATAERAHFWHEWRRKGWAMPVTVGFGMTFGLAVWAIFSRNPEELFGGFVAGAGLLPIAALVGALAVGNMSSKDSMAEIGSFLATRPMNTSDMARILLKVAAWSVLLAWLIWAVGFGVVYAISRGPGRLPGSIEWDWWHFPASLLGAWIVLGIGASLGLLGRPYLFVQVLAGLLGAHIGLVIITGYTLSRESQAQFTRGAAIVIGAAFLLGTAWAFAAARRRELIGRPAMYVAASFWALLVVVAAATWPLPFAPEVHEAAILLGISALVVAPLATAPLALAWNRVR